MKSENRDIVNPQPKQQLVAPQAPYRRIARNPFEEGGIILKWRAREERGRGDPRDGDYNDEQIDYLASTANVLRFRHQKNGNGASAQPIPVKETTASPAKALEQQPSKVTPKVAVALSRKYDWVIFPANLEDGEKKSYKSAEHSNGEGWGMTKHPSTIRNDFSKWSRAGIGIPTGSINKIFVVEVDTPAGHAVDGEAALRTLEAEHGPLPNTLMAISPSGSKHRYYRHPGGGIRIKNSVSELAQGVDVRGDGGMVIAPPSVRPGEGMYRWLNDAPIAEAPQWLLDLVIDHSPATATVSLEDENEWERFAREVKEAPIGKVRAAMAVVPNPDYGYEQWNKVAMAIFAPTGGSEEGFEIFDQWSQKSEAKYGGTREKWEALRRCPPNKISAGSIFHWADEADPSWREAYEDERQSAETTKLQNAEVENEKPSLAQLLAKMNNHYAVLPIGSKTRVAIWDADPDFPNRQTIVRASTFEDFRQLQDKYHIQITGTGPKGKPKTIEMGLGSWWLGHSQRRQYDNGMRFMPDRDEKVVNHTFNLWSGFSVEARRPEGSSGAQGCQLLLDHGLKVICNGNEQHFDYLMKREAFIAQNRTRSEIALGLRTEEEGTGKGTWCRHLNHLYGPHALQVQIAEHVTGKHNPHLERLLRLTADEALFALDPRHRNALYFLITEPRITIEPKFVDAYSARNYLNIDVISNAKHFIPVSGYARRFFVPTVSAERANDHEYFRKIGEQMRNEGGYEALLYHLLYEIDIRDFNVRAVPKTAALAEQVAYSRKGIDLLVEAACNSGIAPCQQEDSPGVSTCSDYSVFHPTGHHVISKGFDHFIEHHVDNELKRMGALTVKRRLAAEWGCITGKAARKQVGGERVNSVMWAPLGELRERFESKYGPQEWLHPEVTSWRNEAGQTAEELEAERRAEEEAKQSQSEGRRGVRFF